MLPRTRAVRREILKPAFAGLAIGLLLSPLHAQGERVVRQVKTGFMPSAVEVERGGSLAITNDDPFLHHVFVESPGFRFDSGEQKPGETIIAALPGTRPLRRAMRDPPEDATHRRRPLSGVAASPRRLNVPRLPLLAALVALRRALFQPARALEIVGLAADGTLLTFDSAKPRVAKRLRVDRHRSAPRRDRPAPRRRCALRARREGNDLRRCRAATDRRASSPASRCPSSPAPRPMVDFNPQADRLRLINLAGVSYRVVTTTGEVAVDGTLRYAPGDRNAGKAPTITTGAYTNAFAGARGTELFNIDTALDVLVLQSPPNDGVLQTRGSLGVDFSPTTAFDITPTADGDNLALAVSKRVLYRIDLATGRAQARRRDRRARTST
jgi:hypothetical protein